MSIWRPICWTTRGRGRFETAVVISDDTDLVTPGPDGHRGAAAGPGRVPGTLAGYADHCVAPRAMTATSVARCRGRRSYLPPLRTTGYRSPRGGERADSFLNPVRPAQAFQVPQARRRYEHFSQVEHRRASKNPRGSRGRGWRTASRTGEPGFMDDLWAGTQRNEPARDESSLFFHPFNTIYAHLADPIEDGGAQDSREDRYIY